MKKLSVSLVAGLALATPALADVYGGHVSPGTANTHSFSATTGDFIMFSAWDFGGSDAGTPDSFIGLKRPNASIAITDDDDSIGLMSHLWFRADATGTWDGVVTGFGDPDLNGSGHIQDYDYRAVITTVDTSTSSGANGSFGTADSLVFVNGSARVGATLAAGDTDYYSFAANVGELITAEALGFTATGSIVDTFIELYDSTFTLVDSDDDDGEGLSSALHHIATSSGAYYLKVRGFGATTAGDYRAVVSVPAPGALALLGLGGLVAARRRRA